jgi:uncharacterized protein YjbI with pentapeptide repeats
LCVSGRAGWQARCAWRWPRPAVTALEPTDVQAALTVVLTRDKAHDGSNTVVDLSHTNLTLAHLDAVALANVNFTDANLTGAFLFGDNLSGASLTGDNLSVANLTHANLTHAIGVPAKAGS